jgi:hypothetical protein
MAELQQMDQQASKQAHLGVSLLLLGGCSRGVEQAFSLTQSRNQMGFVVELEAVTYASLYKSHVTIGDTKGKPHQPNEARAAAIDQGIIVTPSDLH